MELPSPATPSRIVTTAAGDTDAAAASVHAHKTPKTASQRSNQHEHGHGRRNQRASSGPPGVHSNSTKGAVGGTNAVFMLMSPMEGGGTAVVGSTTA